MNNPYLVCSDRELRVLPTQWLFAERWDKAGSLLYDLRFMDATVGRLGIDELLQDYAAALRFLSKEDGWYEKLTITNRILNYQAHNLRGRDVPAAQPAFFLQQLRNDFFEFDLIELEERAEAELNQLGKPYLCERFKVSGDFARTGAYACWT